MAARIVTLRRRTARADEGRRLDDVLNEWLPEVLGRRPSRAAVRRLVLAGQVVVGDRPVRRPSFALAAGTRLTVRADLERLVPAAAPEAAAAAAAGLTILFEDEALLAVAKPAGLQVHSSADPGRPDLFELVRARLSARARPGAPAPYLALHHRLDRETSGVVLFAVAREANAALGRQFAGRLVCKTYVAIVSAPRRPALFAWRVANRLASTGTGRRAVMAGVAAGGEEAETTFRLVSWTRAAGLVEAHPLTGRKHQVRAHLAGGGLPILGDTRYGGAASLAGHAAPRVMLHAARLELAHPVSGARLAIGCAPPPDFTGLCRALGLDLEAALTPRRPGR